MSSSDSPSGSAPAARPRRRWLQYSLRSLFVLTALCAVLVWRGVNVYHAIEDEEAAIATLTRHGIVVWRDFPLRPGHVESSPKWFLWLVGKPDFSHAWKVDFTGPEPRMTSWESSEPKQLPNPAREDAAMLAYLPGLQALELYGKAIDDDSLSYLRGATHLKELTLRATSIKGTGFSAISRVPIEKLIVKSHCPFSDEGYAGLAKVRAIKHLEFKFATERDYQPSIVKQFGKMDPEAIDASSFSTKAFEEIGKLTELEQLYLHGPSVTDEGIAKLTHLKKLRSLDMIHVAITDEAFASLKEMTALTHLGLKSNHVTGEGLGLLVDSQIESLGLDGTQFQPIACIYLARMRKLKGAQFDINASENIPYEMRKPFLKKSP